MLAGGDGEDALVSPILSVSFARSNYFIFDWNDKGRLRSYDSNGRFMGIVGREGRGPGEYVTPSNVFSWGRDQLGIIDSRQQRLTILDADQRKVIATHPLPSFAVLGDTKAFSDQRMIAVGVIYTDESIGLPLHLLDSAGRLVRSLGADPIIVGEWDAGAFIRFTAFSSEGAIWSATRDEYRVERWDTAGLVLQTIRRNVAWFPPITEPVVITTDPDRPPTPHTAGVWEDENGWLWVFINVPRDDWRKELVLREAVAGRSQYRFRSTPEMMFVTQVEVIDPKTEQLIASGSIPMGVSQVLANGTPVTPIMVNDRPQLIVWRMTLHSTKGG